MLLGLATVVCRPLTGLAEESPPAGRPRLLAQTDTPRGALAFAPGGEFFCSASGLTAKLWHLCTGRLIRRFVGHEDGVTEVCFSPDGSRLATVCVDDSLRIWEVATGRTLLRIPIHRAPFAVAFSPDGKRILTGDYANSVRIWDAETGRELLRLEGHERYVQDVAWSPDGAEVASGSWDGTARLWDARTGASRQILRCEIGAVNAVAYSRDGSRLATGGQSGMSVVWDLGTGSEVLRFGQKGQSIGTVVFSPCGHRVAAATCGTSGQEYPSLRPMTRVWDLDTGRMLWSTEGSRWPLTGLAWSEDGGGILCSGAQGTVLYDAETGCEIREYRGLARRQGHAVCTPNLPSLWIADGDVGVRCLNLGSGTFAPPAIHTGGPVRQMDVTPDGDRLVVLVPDAIEVWDLVLRRRVQRREGKLRLVRIHPDGLRVATVGHDSVVRILDLRTWDQVRELPESEGRVWALDFSPGGRLLAVGTRGKEGRVHGFEVESGKELFSVGGFPDGVEALEFSPDGSSLLACGWSLPPRLIDPLSGKTIRSFDGPRFQRCSSFSPDGRHVLTASTQFSDAMLWDAAEGRVIKRLAGHTGALHGCEIFSSGDVAMTSSFFDRTIRLWELPEGRELARVILLEDEGWAIVDPDGRFDASNGGDVEGLHWVVGNEPISLDQLKERYYDPGLLAKLLGHSSEPLREVGAFTAPKLYPEVEVDPPTGEQASLGIRLANRGGGIGRVVVKVNGKELTADARGPTVDPDAEEASISVNLAGDPRLVPGEKNTVEVTAYNAEGYLRSRGLKLDYVPPGEADTEPPSLWAIVVGTSDYSGEAMDLRYAAKDAADFARALRIAGRRLFGGDRVHVTELTTGTDCRPTRAALAAALEAAAQTKPGDLLVVYLSGHGINFGGQDGDFYYLTADARSADLTDPEVRKQVAISSRELTELVKEIPALKQVLILDTCASGKLVERLTEKRNVPGSQVRALERLKDRTGLFVLAGCASTRVSYEATRYAQGLLTHSLLMGMKGAALREDEYVDVSTLLGFAADKVPELAKDIGGVQRPIVAAPKGGASFDIGRLTAEDKARVPLQSVRPLFLRSMLQEAEEFGDSLGLTKAVDGLLNDASAKGADSPLVFVDAREFPEAYRIAGQYVVEGDRVRVRFRLFRGTERSETVTVEGDAEDPAALADAVVAAAQRLIG